MISPPPGRSSPTPRTNTSPRPPIGAPLPFAGSKLSISEMTKTAARMSPPTSGKANLNTVLNALVKSSRRKYQTHANAVSP